MSVAARTLTDTHGDHLGSVSLTNNAAGQLVSEQRYKPYGEVRWSSGAGMPTDFTFTSQRAGPVNYVGSLTDFVARYYSPALGRFVSADTIVPGAGNPQAFNRYAYTLNSPVGYVDPSGHIPLIPLIFIVGVGLLLFTSDVRHDEFEKDPAANQLGLSLLAGDINDIATLATAYDFIEQKKTPYGSSDWWLTAGLAIVPLASGSLVRSGHRVIRGIDTALGTGETVRRVGQKILSDSSVARSLRAEAREIYFKAFPKGKILGQQVHHRIPIEWAHLFPDADPNRLSNLVGLDEAVHEQVSSMWTGFRMRFRALNREPSAKEILEAAQEIDKVIESRIP